MALVMLSNTTRGMESGSFKENLDDGEDIAFAKLRDCEEQQSDAADAAGSLSCACERQHRQNNFQTKFQ